MKNLFDFLSSKIFFINLIIAITIVVLFFGFTYKWLDSYTSHGSTVTVPDLRGLKSKDIELFLKDKSLRFKIADSSIFDLNKQPGTIIEQDPTPSEKVKENRTIYLTTTKVIPPKIKMPNIIDVSYRQAEAILVSYGLKMGTTKCLLILIFL